MLPKRPKVPEGAGVAASNLHIEEDEAVLLEVGDYVLVHGPAKKNSRAVAREVPEPVFRPTPDDYGVEHRIPRDALKRHSKEANAGFLEALKSCAGIAWSSAVKSAQCS